MDEDLAADAEGSEILARVAELGAVHGREPQYRIPRDGIPAAFGVSAPGDLAYMVVAAYEDSRDIARADWWSEATLGPDPVAWEQDRENLARSGPRWRRPGWL